MRPFCALLVFVLLSFSILLAAQPADQQSSGWDPITPEELALKDCPGNPGCAAMILNRVISADDSKLTTSYYEKIKIFHEAGTEYADVEVPYLVDSTEVQKINARTILPSGEEIPFAGDVFDRLVVKSRYLKYQAKTFTLPGVVPGCIIEYSYVIQGRIGFPRAIENPGNFVFDRILTYPSTQWTINDDLYVRTEKFSLTPLSHVGMEALRENVPSNASLRASSNGGFVLEAENVPAFEREEAMPPRAAVEPKVDIFYVVGPSLKSEDVVPSFWDAEARDDSKSLEKYLQVSKPVEDEVKRIITPSDTMDDRLRKIYQRVQQIRYLSYEHFKTEKELKREDLKENKNVGDILKRGYADSNEINYLFIALCRAAGFDASVVEIAGRSERFFNRSLLLSRQLDAMVVRVRTESGDMYFDPATLYCPYGLLPWAESDAGGILLPSPPVSSKLGPPAPAKKQDSSADAGPKATSEGSKEFASTELPGGAVKREAPSTDAHAALVNAIITSTPAPVSKDAIIQRQAKFQVNKSGGLEGTLHVTWVGQESLQLRLAIHEEDAAGKKKALEDEVEGWLPSGANVELQKNTDWESADRNFEADFKVEVPEYGSRTPTRLMISPAVFQAGERYPFRAGDRRSPVYIRYPWREEDDLEFSPAEGFAIEAVPGEQSYRTKFGNYDLTIENRSGVLRVHREMVFEGYYFPIELYSAVRIFFDKARLGDEQLAVLKAAKGN